MAAVNEPEAADHGASPHFWKLALGTVGVVYGDIGEFVVVGTAQATPATAWPR